MGNWVLESDVWHKDSSENAHSLDEVQRRDVAHFVCHFLFHSSKASALVKRLYDMHIISIIKLWPIFVSNKWSSSANNL
jgi:hypothetical protein